MLSRVGGGRGVSVGFEAFVERVESTFGDLFQGN